MSQTVPERLARYPILRTRDLDEARHEVTRRFCEHRLELDGRGTLDARHNHVAGRCVSLNYLHYGGDVRINPGSLTHFYLLQIPLSGSARIVHRGEEVDAGPQRATILSPDRNTRMRWAANCRKLLVQIDKDHLQAAAEGLAGRPLPGPVRFEPGIALTTARGKRLRQLVLACVSASERDNLFAAAGPRQARIEHDLAEALLTLLDSNVRHILERPAPQPAPREIRLAVDYMHAHLGEPITALDIAKAAGINVRTLQKGTQRVYGMSPMRLLREARLDAAHYDLCARTDPPSVTEAALSSGFSHLSRFASEYRDRFGTLPSETLRRATRHLPTRKDV